VKIGEKINFDTLTILEKIMLRFLMCFFYCVLTFAALQPGMASAHDEVVNGSPYRIQALDRSRNDEPGFLRSVDQRVNFRTVSTYERPSNFTLEDAGGDFVRIRIGPRNEEKYLIMSFARGNYKTISFTKPNEDILQNSLNFKWQLLPTTTDFNFPSNNTFRIKSALNGVYLTLEEGRGNAGSRLAVTDNESSARKWTFNRSNTRITFRKRHANLAIGELCPTTLTRGDREFNGNGPKVSGSVDVVIANKRGRTQILALVEFKAEETQDNWSTVENDFIVSLLTNPIAWKAKRIVSPSYKLSSFEKTFGQHKRSLLTITPNSMSGSDISTNGPLKNILIRGDTGGNDISDNSECSDDARIERMAFNTLQVEYEYRPR